jgi:hypothetical protein
MQKILQRINHVEPGNGFSVPEIRVIGSYLNSLSTDWMSRWWLDEIILPLCITTFLAVYVLRTGSMEIYPCVMKIEGPSRCVQSAYLHTATFYVIIY